MSSPAISVRNVWKYFGDFPAVRDISFEVPAGAITALLGRNGAGKTTLLRIIAGLSRPSRGQVDLSTSSGLASQGARIGVIGHGQWIYDDLSAEENLRFFARLYRLRDSGTAIDRWLETVGLAPFRSSRVGEFSRGMRQRLAVARAFLHEPEILLLDEPWTALDDRAVDLLSSLLADALKKGCTALVCSHQLSETLDLATHLLVLDRGRLAFDGENNEALKSSPHDLYQRVL